MSDWKNKKIAIKAVIGDNCLFCEKNALNREYLKARDYYVSQGMGNYEDYDRDAGNDENAILLCERCRARYDLLKEIERGEKSEK